MKLFFTQKANLETIVKLLVKETGGTIAYQNDDGSTRTGNCNGKSGCHNFCNNTGTGSYWC